MIKIDKSKFKMEIISEIYDGVAERVKKNLAEYKKLNKDREDVLSKFYKVFNIEDEIQSDTIKEFLVNSQIKEMEAAIEVFNKGNSSNTLFLAVKEFYNLGNNTKLEGLFVKLSKKTSLPQEVALLEDKLSGIIRVEGTFKKNIKDRCFEILEQDEEFGPIVKDMKLNEEIEKVVNYNILTSQERHKLIEAMNVNVCPYCNRQYITSWLDESDGVHATADLDHFYPKSIYPILSLCLHNFIPSCQICNSRFKLSKDFYKDKHIYPYEDEFGDNARFAIDNIGALMGEKPEFSIHEEASEYKEKINNSLNTFHINEVYKSHTNYVEELIQKFKIYNKVNREEYMKNYKGMFKSEEDILEFAFGNILNKDKMSERPLSKLACDIMDDLIREK